MTETKSTADQDLKEKVRDHYARRAEAAAAGTSSCGCGCGGSGVVPQDELSRGLYQVDEVSDLPPAAVLASLGCGNPVALADLRSGEVVLDLGSGGGIDVLLSAKRVGATGKAYGLDMTDEMLALARANQAKAGVTNVEFLKGDIENIPLPDRSVDVIISNCVVNLAADKRRVLAEAYRVLKPGGRLAISDIVVRGEIPEQVRQSMQLWVGCIAGALSEEEFTSILADSGFVESSIEPTRMYEFEDARAFLQDSGIDTEVLAREIGGRVMGAFIRARKPA